MTGGWGTIAQYLIALAVLTPLAIWRLMQGKDIGFRHWLCGLLVGSGMVFYSNSFLVTDVVRALIFFYMTPVWATLIEAIFLKRPLGWPRVVSIALALSGLWIVVGLEVGLPLPTKLGDYFGLIGGLLVAAGAARTEIEKPAGVFPLLYIIMLFALLAAVAQYPLLRGSLGSVPSTEDLLKSLPLLLGITLLFVIPTMAILMWSPPKIGTGVFGILMLSEVVFGVISAAIFTAEPFGWREITGTTLIVLAGIVEIVLHKSPNNVG